MSVLVKWCYYCRRTTQLQRILRWQTTPQVTCRVTNTSWTIDARCWLSARWNTLEIEFHYWQVSALQQEQAFDEMSNLISPRMWDTFNKLLVCRHFMNKVCSYSKQPFEEISKEAWGTSSLLIASLTVIFTSNQHPTASLRYGKRRCESHFPGKANEISLDRFPAQIANDLPNSRQRPASLPRKSFREIYEICSPINLSARSPPSPPPPPRGPFLRHEASSSQKQKISKPSKSEI